MRLRLVCLTTSQALLWFLFRLVYLSVRYVIWLCTGTAQHIRKHHADNTSYAGTAHVQKIHFRYKMEQVTQSAGLNNFLTAHESFEDPEYLLQRHITLYCVTRDVAAFVESEPDVDVTLSRYSSFLRIAQFQQARKFIIVPIHVFHKLADKIGDPKEKVVFLPNTSRCGSTLLTQVFEETGRIMAISEPDAMYSITCMFSKLPESEISALIKSSVRLVCKSARPNMDAFVIKLAQPNMILTPVIMANFPHAKHIFMYRNGYKVAHSLSKLIRSVPNIEFLMHLSQFRIFIDAVRMFSSLFGVPMVGFETLPPSLNAFHVGAIVWVNSMRKYLDFREKSLPIKAVRYEDIMSDPHYAIQQTFKYCDFPYDIQQTCVALERDSQENSPISRASLRPFSGGDVITDESWEHIDALCDKRDVPRLREPGVVPDTITHKPLQNGYHKNSATNGNSVNHVSIKNGQNKLL